MSNDNYTYHYNAIDLPTTTSPDIVKGVSKHSYFLKKSLQLLFLICKRFRLATKKYTDLYCMCSYVSLCGIKQLSFSLSEEPKLVIK